MPQIVVVSGNPHNSLSRNSWSWEKKEQEYCEHCVVKIGSLSCSLKQCSSFFLLQDIRSSHGEMSSCRTVWKETKQLIQVWWAVFCHLKVEGAGESICETDRQKLENWFLILIFIRRKRIKFWIYFNVFAIWITIQDEETFESGKLIWPNSKFLAIVLLWEVCPETSILETSTWQKLKCHFSFRSHSGLKSHYVKSCCFKSSS